MGLSLQVQYVWTCSCFPASVCQPKAKKGKGGQNTAMAGLLSLLMARHEVKKNKCNVGLINITVYLHHIS